ncbi:uncharacterized protein LOC121966955 [Plectropomus leopardus]|uniref:uncharacterized protein LOC121966955 n=1 Tax=Plectropomus leopardus TaxID=160734 RepID=UPI001C4CA2AA|nr:uncharacterized protein LOC121966955 [Plectropomus leopardus]
MRGAAMSLTAAASGFLVFLLSVPVIQAQGDYGVTYTVTQICALQGSTVEIPCSFRYPATKNDKTKLWFAKKRNSNLTNLLKVKSYENRVEYLFHEDDNCTLRIRDLRKSDSAEYKFRFKTNKKDGAFTGEPGVTLNVTARPDLQVLVGGSSAQAELKCRSSCNTSYVWYNNEQRMDEETSSYRVSVNDNDRYSCAIKGHEEHRSPPVCE